MPSTFGARIDELIARIGVGDVEGRVEVDQVYAHRQHEDLMFQHPRGGGAKYLERPLYEGTVEYFQHIADELLDRGVVEPMIDNVELLSTKASAAAPRLFGRLSESMHPSVLSDGATAYDRAPRAARASEQELVTEKEALLPPKHYYGRWPPEQLRGYYQIYGFSWPPRREGGGPRVYPNITPEQRAYARQHYVNNGGLGNPRKVEARIRRIAQKYFVLAPKPFGPRRLPGRPRTRVRYEGPKRKRGRPKGSISRL